MIPHGKVSSFHHRTAQGARVPRDLPNKTCICSARTTKSASLSLRVVNPYLIRIPDCYALRLPTRVSGVSSWGTRFGPAASELTQMWLCRPAQTFQFSQIRPRSVHTVFACFPGSGTADLRSQSYEIYYLRYRCMPYRKRH
eukprot:967390-Rhodomonas_salina.2